jgi:cytochrome c2
MLRKINFWKTSLTLAVALVFSGVSFSQGEGIFKAKCATCHQVFKNGTGPKLYKVREKWEAGGAKPGSLYQWVNNWSVAAANDPYAATTSQWAATAMNLFPELKKEEITAVFDWIDAQVEVKIGTPGPTPVGEMETEEEPFPWWLVILGTVFATIIAAVGGVRRQLTNATLASSGQSPKVDTKSYWQEFGSWAWKYKKSVGFAAFIGIVLTVALGIQGLGNIGVVEAYQPSQPIEFPHAIHAGINGIDCKYCHNSVNKGKHAGIPTVNVCMNCHKQIAGEGEAVEQISKIYAAAGWEVNAAGQGKYTGVTKPIVWNKVHVLPDHVAFNHKQHVVVGNIDCKQCHGDMTKQTEAVRVVPVEELNKIEGNVVLTKPTLTMGWCIECHGEKEIHAGPLNGKKDGYYDEIHNRLMKHDKKLYESYLVDGKVTAKELGGWECAKCHY